MPVTKSIRWNVSCELKDCKSTEGYIFDKCTKSEFHRLIKKKGWAVINKDAESSNLYLCADCKNETSIIHYDTKIRQWVGE